MRKPAITLGSLALVAAIALGVIQAGDENSTSSDAKTLKPLTRAQVAKPIPGTPPTLAALRARIGELQEGGAKAFDAQLRALRGYPVVVNAWGSWCPPCKYELPFFQREAARRGNRVAFIGLNVRDEHADAERAAAKYPLPYPSIVDRRSKVTESFKAIGVPVTIFFDAKGKRQIVHQGVFRSEKELSDAIDRYALK